MTTATVHFNDLPNRVQGAIAGKHRVVCDPVESFINSKWLAIPVSVDDFRAKYPQFWGDWQGYRGSMTTGPIVIDVDTAEIIDGHNRVFEAIKRGDKTIEAYIEA